MIFKVDPIRKLRKTQQHLAQAWKVNSGFPGGSDGKESTCNVGDLGSSTGLGRFPEEGNGYHSSILIWRIPFTEKPGRLHSMGSQRARHD